MAANALNVDDSPCQEFSVSKQTTSQQSFLSAGRRWKLQRTWPDGLKLPPLPLWVLPMPLLS